MVLPMLMEIGLQKGFGTALSEFILMQLRLAPVFFTFSLGTKAHHYGRTLLHGGGAKYRSTGRGFVVNHAKFAENYRLYSRSHFVKGMELTILLIVCAMFGETYRSPVDIFITVSMWFMVGTWLFAPFIFNPSGFEWQKMYDDWRDWNKWMRNPGDIGVPPERSWESWWEEEQEHLHHTGVCGIVAEILLSLRFFIYQYGLVYHLKMTFKFQQSFLVYGLSWLVIVLVLFAIEAMSFARRRFSADWQLVFRLIKGGITLTFAGILIFLIVFMGMTFRDMIVCIIAFTPTGWGLILIAQALKPVVDKAGFWGPVRRLAHFYDNVIGLLLFAPVALISWFPYVSIMQTQMLS